MRMLRMFFRRMFDKDIYWKIFSGAMAVFLWFVVMNIINPTETKTFVTNVELSSLQSLYDENYTVLNIDELNDMKIEIKVKGTRPALDDLKKSDTISSIKAIADLSLIGVHPDSTMPQNFAVKVTPKLTDNYVYSYDIVSYSPSSINVMVDKLYTSNRSLSLKTEGKPATSYVADSPECDVDTVIVKGPSTKVGDISSIQAVVDITGKSASVSEQAKVVVVDSEGKELDGFELDPEYVTVKVNIRKEGSIKVNQPQTVGSLPEDLQLSSVEWYPKSLEVKGKSSALEKTQAINLPVIDLSGISSSVSYTYSVKKLLDNTGLTSDTANITVNVKVAAQSEEGELLPMNIQGSDISVTSVDDSMGYRLDNIEVILKGDQDIINNLSVADIRPTINATGLTKGKHSITVNLYLPSGVVAVKNSADIILYEKTDNSDRDDLNIEPETVTEVTTSTQTEETSEVVQEESSVETTVNTEE